jgi:hypothetical protein
MLLAGSNNKIIHPYKNGISDIKPNFVGNIIIKKNRTIEIQFITNAKNSSLEFIKVLSP